LKAGDDVYDLMAAVGGGSGEHRIEAIPACSWCGPRDSHGLSALTFHRMIEHPAAAPCRRDALRAEPLSGGSPSGGLVWCLGRLS
jgi:hypothetical protein